VSGATFDVSVDPLTDVLNGFGLILKRHNKKAWDLLLFAYPTLFGFSHCLQTEDKQRQSAHA